MNANAQNEKLKEQISEFVDGEHADQELDFLLSALRNDEHKKDWELYHQIGDALNSDDLSIQLSKDFNAKLTASLASEVIYANPKRKTINRFNYKIAYATAAMLALVAILVPKFAGHDGAEVSAPYFSGQFAAAGSLTQPKATLVSSTPVQTADNHNEAKPENRPRMLRDPQLDSYLAAHQRYSKSMYSAVEYETGPISQEVEK